MDETTSRNYISQYFPDIAIRNIEKIGEGTGNVAYEVNDDLIFRFPKKIEDRKRLEIEISIQKILRTYSSLPIPEFIYIPPDHSFVGYKKLLGTSLLLERNNEKDWDTLAKQLGIFLSKLHAIPIQELQDSSASVEKRSFVDWLQLGQAYYDKTKHVIPDNHLDAINDFFHAKLPTSDIDVPLCHNDLGIEHILVNENRITGIIDWGGVALTDSACDFARIYRDLGPDILERVLREYTPLHATKDDLRERAIFYGKCLFFEDLYFGEKQAVYREKSLSALHWMF